MGEPVNRRPYVSPQREAAAARTRQRVLQAARTLFSARGWEGATIAEIAREAGVSLDTVYAAVGPKPVLIRQVVDEVLGEGRGPVVAEQRRYVEEIRAADTAEDMLAIYAEALGRVMPEASALLLALRDAGMSDADCARVWQEVIERRARNMLRFAAELRGTGQLRADLDDQAVADQVWVTNSPEYYALLHSRGWTVRRYADHLADLWRRLLLAAD